MVMVDDTLLEVINDSIVKEQLAQEFYQDAADMVEDTGIKEFFLELKQDEVGHERLLMRVIDDLKGGRIVVKDMNDVPEDSLTDLGISRYLEAKPLESGSSYQEAMVIAMKREEEAWRNYSKMTKMTNSAELKDIFTLLAQVEAGHLRRIEALYERDVLEGY